MSVSQKINHLTHTLFVLYKIVGSPPPHLCKKICVLGFGRLGRRWQQVAIHASGNPPTKVNGKYSFWPILCNPAPNTQPCYIASVCGGLTYAFWPILCNPAPNTQPCYIASVCGGLTLLFLEKNPDLFPNQNFVRVRYVPMLQKSPN